MPHTPPIPPEQRSPGPDANGQEATRDDAAETQGLTDRRDQTTGLQSSQPGDADVNLEQQGRQGDINQNTRHQGRQQDR